MENRARFLSGLLVVFRCDVGKRDGIRKGMPVVTDRGLVGQVVELLIEAPGPRGRAMLGRTPDNRTVIVHGPVEPGLARPGLCWCVPDSTTSSQWP